ncbi:MAG: cysteine--tRNA ligase [Pseudomonadota bacterium]
MLRLFDSFSKEKIDFSPINPNNVRLYVCGPTVYDLIHVGNARPLIVFDVLYRLLRSAYPRVTYVRNITDIDDKIMARAKERAIDIQTLTTQTTADFHKDVAALGTLAPDFEPKATEYVDGMIAMIAGLIEQGFAYAADGHVLFRVKSYPAYGSLSKLPQQDLEDGARVEVATYKEDPKDFVLWKPSSDDQVGWDSPWSRGRPGWHIECSVMSSALLGQTFDIHGGGIDLIFPHHENEMAQSCCFHSTQKMVNVWMHNGHLQVNGEKMSKSLGNFFTVREVLEKVPGEVIRYAFLNTHYRQPIDFSEAKLAQAHNNMNRFYLAMRGFDDVMAGTPFDAFIDALHDDLNTPLALSTLHEQITELNKTKNPDIAAGLKASFALLGLLQCPLADWFSGSVDVERIERLIEERTQARLSKDFTRADEIRRRLEAERVMLEDTAHGTLWRTT